MSLCAVSFMSKHNDGLHLNQTQRVNVEVAVLPSFFPKNFLAIQDDMSHYSDLSFSVQGQIVPRSRNVDSWLLRDASTSSVIPFRGALAFASLFCHSLDPTMSVRYFHGQREAHSLVIRRGHVSIFKNIINWSIRFERLMISHRRLLHYPPRFDRHWSLEHHRFPIMMLTWPVCRIVM